MAVYVLNNKKPHYIICYEGGSCGNFIASLIRTMADSTYYDEHGKLTSHGSCDHMSGGQRLSYDYVFDVFGRSIYPESEENIKILLDAVANPDTTYAKFLMPHERKFNFDITTIHYNKPFTINKLLENKNVYVILITYNIEDANLISRNFIYKVIEKERERESYKFEYFKKLLTDFKKYDTLDELEKIEHLHDLPDSMINDIISCHIRKVLVNQERYSGNLESNNRLIKLPFNLIYSDKDAILKILSNCTKLKVNESTYRLYDDYMLAQEPILNKLKC